eukprot:Gb_21700 [translate_table: standard]
MLRSVLGVWKPVEIKGVANKL